MIATAALAGPLLGRGQLPIPSDKTKPSPSPPVRLAVLPEDPAFGTAVDVLTAELSRKDSLQLLERTEIEKVYREQGLSAANQDYLKLGQVLGANGLLLLSRSKEGTNQFLAARLVAVKPGVVIGAVRSPWPLPDAPQWAKWIGNRFSPLLPKLGVLVKDAIPVSVVNLRSSVRSAEAQETEQQLTVLAIERLSRERELFVLERRRMELLSAEKELRGMNESAFWNGSYLLDGVVDRDGFSKETVALSARLVPPKGGAPILIEVNGPRANLSEVINRLVIRVLAGLKLAPSSTAWNPADEAAQYFEEAKWAFKWGMLKEAQAASEAGWTLGDRTAAAAELRIRIYLEESAPNWEGWRFDWDTVTPGKPTSPANLDLGIRAFGLYRQAFAEFAAPKPKPDPTWYTLGLDVLSSATELLQPFYRIPQSRLGEEDKLSELRRLARETADLISNHSGYRTLRLERNLLTVEADGGAFWYDTPEQALEMYRSLVRSNLFGSIRRRILERHHSIRTRFFALPVLAVWNDSGRGRETALWNGFIRELYDSTNIVSKIEGYYLTCVYADTKADHADRLRELMSKIIENALTLDSLVPSYLNWLLLDMEALINNNESYGIKEFFDFERKLRETIESAKRKTKVDALKSFLASNTRFDPSTFSVLCNFLFSESDARELLPIVREYHAQLAKRRDEKPPPFVGNWNGAEAQLKDLERKLVEIIEPPNNQRRTGVALKPVPVPETPSTNLLRVTRFWSMPPEPPAQAGFDPSPEMVITSVAIREGKIWLLVRYGFNPYKAVVFRVDLQDFKTETIKLPLEKVRVSEQGGFGGPVEGRLFEVLGDSLYFNGKDAILRYSLRVGKWEDLALPLQGWARPTVLGGRLFLSTPDSILELGKDGQKVQILASSRRHPALTLLDSVDGYKSAPIFPGPNGSIRALVQGKVYTLDTNRNDWTVTAVLPPAANGVFCGSFDAGAVFRCVSGTMETRWLLLPKDQTSLELALFEPASFRKMPGLARPSRGQSEPEKPHWNHPPEVPLFDSAFAMGMDGFLMLVGDLAIEENTGRGPVLKEQGGHHALLLGFERKSPEPIVTPLWFDEAAAKLSAEQVSKFQGFSFDTPQGRVTTRLPGPVIFKPTPQGLVVGAANLPGFWLVPPPDARNDARVARKPDPNQNPDQALLAAVETGDVAAAKQLLARGAAADARNDKGWTALIVASFAGNFPLVQALVEKGADVNASSTNQLGSTVLNFATEGNNPEAIKLLLDHGADVKARGRNGFTPLYIAVVKAKKTAAEILISRGADVNEFGYDQSGQKYTALMGAVSSELSEMIELLLAKGADLERKSARGETALMQAARLQSSAMVKLLIQRGANVNAAGPNGHTALIFAAYSGRMETVKLLLAAGANPNAVAHEPGAEPGEGYEAARVAAQQNYPELAALIQEAQKGRTPGRKP